MVIHSCTSLSFSGLERYVLDLAAWQAKQGRDVLLFCRKDSYLEKNAKSRGVSTWAIDPDARPGLKFWIQQAASWKRILMKRKVTLHLHAGGEPKFHLPWIIIKYLRPQKVIMQYHMWINHYKNDPFHWFIFTGVNEIWCSSESAKTHLMKRLPAPKRKFRVVPYGREVDYLRNAPKVEWREFQRKRLKLKESDRVAITVSRIEPIKGIGELFDAFVIAAPKNERAHLVIVGDVSPNDPNAEQFQEELMDKYQVLPEGVRKRIHFMGYQDDCLPIIAAADFYVLPSYEECMSLAMLDALVLGLPILGTDSGGTPSIARPNETGALVPPRDTESLAKVLEEFFSDEEKTQKMGETARKMGQNFDKEKIFQQIWDWYTV